MAEGETRKDTEYLRNPGYSSLVAKPLDNETNKR